MQKKARDRYLRHLVTSNTNTRLLEINKTENAYVVTLSNFSDLEILKVDQPETKNVFLQATTMIFDASTKRFVTTGSIHKPVGLSYIEKLRFKLSADRQIELLLTTPANSGGNYQIFIELMTVVRGVDTIISKKKQGWLVIPLKKTSHRIEALYFADPKALETYELSTVAKILNSKISFDMAIKEFVVPVYIHTVVPALFISGLPISRRATGWQIEKALPGQLIYNTVVVFNLKVERIRLELDVNLETQLLAFMKKEKKFSGKVIEKKLEVSLYNARGRTRKLLDIDINEKTGKIAFGRQGSFLFEHVDSSQRSVLIFKLMVTLKPKAAIFKNNTAPITDLCVLYSYVLVDEIDFKERNQTIALTPLEPGMETALKGVAVAFGSNKLFCEITKNVEEISNKKVTFFEKTGGEEDAGPLVEEIKPRTQLSIQEIEVIGVDIQNVEMVKVQMKEAEKAYQELTVESKKPQAPKDEALVKPTVTNKEGIKNDTHREEIELISEEIIEEKIKTPSQNEELDFRHEEPLMTLKAPLANQARRPSKHVKFQVLAKPESGEFSDFDDMFADNFDDEEKSKVEETQIVDIGVTLTKDDFTPPIKVEIKVEQPEVLNAAPIKPTLKEDSPHKSPEIITEPKKDLTNFMEAELVSSDANIHDHVNGYAGAYSNKKQGLRLNRKLRSCVDETDRPTKNLEKTKNVSESMVIYKESHKENNPNPKTVINLLKEEIKVLRLTKEQKDRKVKELAQDLDNMKKMINQPVFVESSPEATEMIYKKLSKSARNPANNNVDEISYSVELKDIQAQRLTIQLHSITFNEKSQGSILPHEKVVMKVRSLLNEDLSSQACYYSTDSTDMNGRATKVPIDISRKMLEYNCGKQLHMLNEKGDGSKVYLESVLNPFKQAKDSRSVFFIHKHYLDMLYDSDFEVSFEDAETKLRLYKCNVQCKMFLRQGKMNHYAVLSQPLILANRYSPEDQKVEIGTVNFLVMNQVVQEHDGMRTEMYQETNNLMDVEYVFENVVKEDRTQKSKKQVIRRKQVATKPGLPDANKQELAADGAKRRMFIVNKFKNNFLTPKAEEVDFETLKLEKLKNVLHEKKYVQKKHLVAFRAKRMYIPIKFTNTGLGSNFRIQHSVVTDTNNKYALEFKQVVSPNQVDTAVKSIDLLLAELTSGRDSLKKEHVVTSDRFDMPSGQSASIIFSFLALDKNLTYSFTIDISNEEGKVICGYKFSICVMDNYDTKVFTIMNSDPERFSALISLKMITDINKIINNVALISSNDTFNAEVTEGSMLVRYSSACLKRIGNTYAATSSTPIEGHLYVYESEERIQLLGVIKIRVLPLTTFDVLLRPGVAKKIDLRVDTEFDRQVKVISEKRKEIIPSNTMISMRANAYTSINCSVYSCVPEREFTALVSLYDIQAACIFKYFELNIMVRPVEPKKTIFKKVSNSKDTVLYMLFLNPKKSQSNFKVNTSDEDYIVPVASQFTLAAQAEVQVLLSVNKTKFVGRKSFHVFFTDEQLSVNECFQVDIEFADDVNAM